jgi:hypothetical protein
VARAATPGGSAHHSVRHETSTAIASSAGPRRLNRLATASGSVGSPTTWQAAQVAQPKTDGAAPAGRSTTAAP